MLRKLLIFCGIIWLFVTGWDSLITRDGFLRYFDKHPHQKGTATGLYMLANYNELFNNNSKALEIYQRIVERYPKSRYGMDSQYGLASSYERLRKIDEAIAEYQKLLENYPDCPYRVTVQNGISLLKTSR